MLTFYSSFYWNDRYRADEMHRQELRCRSFERERDRERAWRWEYSCQQVMWSYSILRSTLIYVSQDFANTKNIVLAICLMDGTHPLFLDQNPTPLLFSAMRIFTWSCSLVYILSLQNQQRMFLLAFITDSYQYTIALFLPQSMWRIIVFHFRLLSKQKSVWLYLI